MKTEINTGLAKEPISLTAVADGRYVMEIDKRVLTDMQLRQLIGDVMRVNEDLTLSEVTNENNKVQIYFKPEVVAAV